MELKLVKPFAQLRDEHRYEDSINIAGMCLVRGSLTEFVGGLSSGKVSHALAIVAQLTQKGEVCAVIDVANSFNPAAALLSGVVLENLLWIKCKGNTENAIKSIDLLTQGKGFGVVWLNTGRTPIGKLRNIPSNYWFRFRALLKGSSTLLIITATESILGAASRQSFFFSRNRAIWLGSGRFKLLDEFWLNLKQRKPLTANPVLTRIGRNYKDL